MNNEINIDDLWTKLTDSEKDAWKQVQATLGSPGFKIVHRDVLEIGDNLTKVLVDGCQNWDQYVYIKGQLNALQLLLNLDGRLMQQLAQAVNERAAQAEESPVEIPEDFA